VTLTLPERIVAVHTSLLARELPHAFGGALALAWCTQRARGTIDVDVNVFVDASRAGEVLAALPAGVEVAPAQVADAERDGQVRVWWDRTPIDVFLDTTAFHVEVGSRVRFEPLLGVALPFLSCRDLAVFKAFFDRTKDWADLEEMAAAGALDRPAVVGVLLDYLGPDDHRIARLNAL
jgi:hypothetical protein